MISIVLPVYNCSKELAGGLGELVSVLKQSNKDYEIIIVDDCSRDGVVVEQVANTVNGIYLRNETNQGKGYTVRRGVLKATGDIVICMDGDFPFDLSIIPAIVNAFSDPQVSVVIGDRTLEQSVYPPDLSLLRKTGSNFISFIAGRLFTPGLYDTQCGVKAYRSATAKAIFSQITRKRFSFDVEVLFLAIKRHAKIVRLPVTVKSQAGSTVNVLRDGFGMLGAFFAIYFNNIGGKYKLNEKGDH